MPSKCSTLAHPYGLPNEIPLIFFYLQGSGEFLYKSHLLLYPQMFLMSYTAFKEMIFVTKIGVYHRLTHDVFLNLVSLFGHLLFALSTFLNTVNPIDTICQPLVWLHIDHTNVDHRRFSPLCLISA